MNRMAMNKDAQVLLHLGPESFEHLQWCRVLPVLTSETGVCFNWGLCDEQWYEEFFNMPFGYLCISSFIQYLFTNLALVLQNTFFNC